VEYLYTHTYQSPVGPLYLGVDRNGCIHRVSYSDFRVHLADDEWEVNKYACGEVEFQLDEYFAGNRVHFSVNTHLEGTSFQLAVWNRLRKISFGSTMSYSTLAQKIGRREAAQAVGNAVGANPLVVIIPCHRIISASGSIGSYARKNLDEETGRRIKEHLLRLEGAIT
jgi:methylated-DNA-[protein]-cysteine S-methyltransferase